MITNKNAFKDINEKITEPIETNSLFWYGRAATGLALFLRYLKATSNIVKPKIVLPSTSCISPSFAAYLEGYDLVFCDIDLSTGLMSTKDIEMLITENTLAVLYIHLYGNTENLRELRSFCDTRKVFLIEDCAQAFWGSYSNNNKTVGYYGHASIFSFNTTKIIESGGGALTIQSEKLAYDFNKFIDSIDLSKLFKKPIKSLALSFRNLQHSIIGLHRLQIPVFIKTNEFYERMKIYEPLYYSQMQDDNLELFRKNFSNIDRNLEMRVENSELYNEFLETDKFKIISDWKNSKIVWRLTMLNYSGTSTTEILEEIRSKGFLASDHYWNAESFWSESVNSPNSVELGRRVLNLWVDNKVNVSKIKEICQILNKIK